MLVKEDRTTEKTYVAQELFKCVQLEKAVEHIISHPQFCCVPIPKDSSDPTEWMLFWSANMLFYGYQHKIKPRSIRRLRRRILKYYDKFIKK